MPNIYDKGDMVKFTASWTLDGAASDPTTVRFKIKKSSGAITTYVNGQNTELVKDSVGNYHVDFVLDEVGQWSYRWEGEGGAHAAEGGRRPCC